MTEATEIPKEDAPQAATIDPNENQKQNAMDQDVDPSAAQAAAAAEEETTPVEDPETSAAETKRDDDDSDENITLSGLKKKREVKYTDVEVAAVNGGAGGLRSSRKKESEAADCDGATWKCACGNVVDVPRRRCGKCHRWKDGMRSASKATPAKNKRAGGDRNSGSGGKSTRAGSGEKATAAKYNNLPPGIQLSPPKPWKTGSSLMECKVLHCGKREQSNNDGFCRSHYNLIVLGQKSDAKVSVHAEGTTGVTRLCDCGEEMEGKRRCARCLKRGGGKEHDEDAAKEGEEVTESNMHGKSDPQDANLEEDPNKDPLKCNIKDCNRFKQSKSNGMCWQHFRKVTAKYDNVEPARAVPKRSSPKRNVKSASASPSSRSRRNGAAIAALMDSVRRSGRVVSSPKDSHLDDSVSESSEVKVGNQRGRKRTLLDDPVSESSEAKSGRQRGRKRTREDEVNKSALCQFDGCQKYRRAGGYCSQHTREVGEAHSPTLCKFEGCTKFRQIGRGGFCCAHYTVKMSVGQSEESAEDGLSKQGNESVVKRESDLDGIRKTLDETYNVKSKAHTESVETPSPELLITSSTRTKNSDGKYRCKVVSCERFAQIHGFCKRHNAMFSEDPTQFSEAASVEKSPVEKKLNNSEALPAAKSPVRKKLKSADSRVSFGGEQHDKKSKADYQFKEGDMVMVEGGGPARVIKVHSTGVAGNSCYDLVYILGGREQGVDGARLTHCTNNILKSALVHSEESERNRKPLLNVGASKNVMLALTRYQLLSGQDCWICTSCSVVVSSLTLSCGACKMHPSFVPLEFREFEEFVRGQRRKQNRLWLRKEETSRALSENNSSSPAFTGPNHTSLCRFQGCVQPIQNSCDGYCELHINAIDLVKEQDQPFLSNYMSHLFAQMKTCILTEDDKFGAYRDRDLGQPGITCRHCEGQRIATVVKGRFFPKDEASLKQPSFIRGLAKHLKSCDKCPKETKEKLVLLEAAESAEDKIIVPGGKKKFLRRVWNRLQRLSRNKSTSCILQGCTEIAKANCDGLLEKHQTEAAARSSLPSV